MFDACLAKHRRGLFYNLTLHDAMTVEDDGVNYNRHAFVMDVLAHVVSDA